MPLEASFHLPFLPITLNGKFEPDQSLIVLICESMRYLTLQLDIGVVL